MKLYIEFVETMLGVNRKTLFYWERTGKIPKAKREPMSNYRYWSPSDLSLILKKMGQYASTKKQTIERLNRINKEQWQKWKDSGHSDLEAFRKLSRSSELYSEIKERAKL